MEGVVSLASKFGQLMGKELRQLRAVGGEVVELRDELATMNALLRMQSEVDDGAVDHFVREWMKQLRELAYDVDDCVDLYIFRIKCRRGDGLIVRSKRLLATIFPRHNLVGDIKALRARAVSISERHARYGVRHEALRRSPSLAAPVAVMATSERAPYPRERPCQLVGIREQAQVLADRVKATKEEEGDEKLKVFSIVGFSGFGKTTLAMEVCRQLESDFHCHAQVSVSQAFDGGKDLVELLKRVLRQTVKAKSENSKGINEEENDSVGIIEDIDLETLTSTLKELLEDKRYLIVIDNVWTIAAWDAIRSNLPESNCGSRIIVTTPIMNVAKECSATAASEDYIYHIKPLSLDDSKKLFLNRAFGAIGASCSCPKGLEETVDQILKRCAGIPLAIVSIGGLLASYRFPEDKVMWDRICKSIGSQMESHPTHEGMRRILTLSYDHLPYYLKGCMMYLSIFPEDYEVSIIRLLYRWIAEGLVEEKRRLTPMEVAESYYSELISRSMIDACTVRRESCRVHNMMLEVLVSKSLEANFVSLVGGQYEGMAYDRIRRLSNHGIDERAANRDGNERMDVQHVRSLSMFPVGGGKLLDRLGEFTLLRVLDLEDCKALQDKHLVDICRMYLLRFLNLNGTDITVMPREVGQLKHLLMLDVDCTCLQGLPETVTKLEKLEYVNFGSKPAGRTIMWSPPRGVSNMKALRKVNYIEVNDVEVAKEIGELGQMQKLGIYIKIESSKDLLLAVARSVSRIYSLQTLNVLTSVTDSTETMDNFLFKMPSPPRLLHYLYLYGVIGELPNWVRSLVHLTEISIKWVQLKGDPIFDVLHKLPSLQTMTLGIDSDMDSVLVVRTTHTFPVLRTFHLTSHGRMPEVLKFEKGCMVNLKVLSVTFPGGSKSIIGIDNLPNLKEVQLIGKKNDPALSDALDQFKDESKRRFESNQFQFTVGVKYE